MTSTVSLLVSLLVAMAGAIGLASAACDTGYIANNGNCYRFYGIAKSWAEARKTCQQTGGDLAIIDTEQEAANVKALRQSIGKANTYYWIGGTQEPHARSPFQWLNGQTIANGLWFAGEPNQINGKDKLCVDLGVGAQQHKMNDWPCKNSLPFMCEKKCPSGWVDNQYGGCYKFVGISRTWDQSRVSCIHLQGTLAVIDTRAEAEELMLLRKNTGKQNTYYWIGAIQQPDAKGAFQWVNGGRFDSGLWFSGEPNQVNRVNRQCVDLGVGGQQLKMNDYPCSARLPYMCEKEL